MLGKLLISMFIAAFFFVEIRSSVKLLIERAECRLVFGLWTLVSILLTVSKTSAFSTLGFISFSLGSCVESIFSSTN